MKHSIYTKYLLVYFCSLLLITACNNQENTRNTTDTTAVENAEKPVSKNTCYLGVSGKDSIKLHIEIKGDSVHGNLNYLMAQKDSNTGTFTGKMHGDTLLADYLFSSEGMQSIRQVSFIINDSMAFAGYGDMMENGNKMEFKNPSSLIFETKNPLKLVNCLP